MTEFNLEVAYQRYFIQEMNDGITPLNREGFIRVIQCLCEVLIESGGVDAR
jgi:hypothetical protein